MSIADVKCVHAFGVSPAVAGGLAFKSERTLAYACGDNCVMLDLLTGTQEFLPASPECSGITALTISAKRRYIAICEQGAQAKATIWELSSMLKKSEITSSECKVFVSAAFSADPKYLITLGGPPDYMLIYWAWDKGKIHAQVKATNSQGSPVYEISFHPVDNTQLCAVGDGIFRLYRYGEGSLKQFGFQQLEQRAYRCHDWLSEDRLAVATDDGHLMTFHGRDLKQDIELSCATVDRSQTHEPMDVFSSGNTSSITCLVSSNRYIFASSGQLVHVLEKSLERGTDRDFFFEKVGSLKIPSSSDAQLSYTSRTVAHLAVSPSEERLVVCTHGAQMYTITMEEINSRQSGLSLLCPASHSAPITGMTTCKRKPLLLTCSVDRTLQLWDYERCTQELRKDFTEEVFSVALHPSGLFLLAGFNDKLRLMNILIDDFSTFKEFNIRACRECAFSNGGHLFAACNFNLIQIYHSYTFELITSFKGHSGRIRGLVWSSDDKRLISCGMDGGVYEWLISSHSRVGDCVMKSAQYTGAVLSADHKLVYTVSSDSQLREINTQESSVQRSLSAADTTFSQLALSHSGRVMFAGTSAGMLFALKFPLSQALEYKTFLVHRAAINRMAFSMDDRYLFTASEDGSLYFFRVQDKESRGLQTGKREVDYAGEIVITKTELQEKNSMIAELHVRIDELKVENEYQLRLQSESQSEKIRAMTEKFLNETEALKTRHKLLLEEREKDEGKFQEELSQEQERREEELQHLETTNNQKLMVEYEKYHEQQDKSQALQARYDQHLSTVKQQRQSEIRDLNESYEGKLQQKSTELDQAGDVFQQQKREFAETRRQMEEDVDMEILKIKETYKEKLREAREANIRTTGETGVMKKKLDSLEKEFGHHKQRIEKLQAEHQRLDSIKASLKRDIEQLKKNIRERDETIQDKERRIFELKKKNQELEKFKFVMDYGIKDLKKQIEPREIAIEKKDKQIGMMEGQLTRFRVDNSALKRDIDSYEEQLKSASQTMRRQRQRLHDLSSAVHLFKTDLYRAVGLIQDPKQLIAAVLAMQKQHIEPGEKLEPITIAPDIQLEYCQQRLHLEHSGAALRQQMRRDSEVHRRENLRFMQENVLLLQDIGDLRRELKKTNSQLHDLEVKVKMESKARVRQGAMERPIKSVGAFPLANQETAVPLLQPTDDEMQHVINQQKLKLRHLRLELRDLKQGPSPTCAPAGRLPPLSGTVHPSVKT